MLQITIPSSEMWNSETEEFVYTKEQTLNLEHSLVSLRKWESKWCKPFLTDERKTVEETRDYIKCMTITQNVDPKIYDCITDDIVKQVDEYMNAKMTATWFNENAPGKRSSEQITSEIIYYWMIALQIPQEYQKWHLNTLLTLIRVVNTKQEKPKKMSQADIYKQQRALNEANRKKFNSKG